ncbi:MAG: LamG-like jellyroll fold domain-containing protein, partial [Solirubrobacteraceae bacterium]|nr:LamG-like jellyroll fold domain-containing protein [Solirubrobacteraceae bacterium]
FIVHDRNPDRTPPAVRQVSPRNGAVQQAITSRIGVGMTDNILPGSINAASFIVRPVGGSALAGTYSVQNGIVNFAPAQPLQPSQRYEVVLNAGGLKDYVGNPIASTFTSSFTTAANAQGDALHSWPLAANVNDAVGGNHGTATAADAYADGAMNFAARSGGVTLASDNLATLLGGSATVAFNLKTSQAGHANAWMAPGIFGRDQVGGANDVFWGWIDQTGSLRFTVGDPTAANVGAKSARPINDGTWHQVVLTRDAASGVQTMYVDGVKTSGAGTAGTLGLANKFRTLGQIEGNADFFRGSLSNVRVYGRAMSDAEVASLSRVVHSWPLVSTVNDVVGGNNGVAGPNDLFADGGLNFGARTGGVNLQRTDTANVLGGSASLSFHMKTTQGGSANPWTAPGIFGRDQPSGVNDIFWGWLDQTGALRLSVGNATSSNVGVRSSKAVNDGVWHHVVLTRNASTGVQTMYVDGVKT